jgi:hypothetical protein
MTNCDATGAILSHFFQDKDFEQAADNTVIRGLQIPKGFVNATQMCKANGKRLANYAATKDWNAYLAVVSRETGIPVSQLVVTIDGYGQDGHQGTWMHPDLAIWIAGRISPEFAYWANRTIRAVITGEYLALTPEAERIKRELIEGWEKLRQSGKYTRRSLTDSIKEYMESHEVSESYAHWIYPNVSDCLNLGLFGLKAAELVKARNCDPKKLRDTYNDRELKMVERVEDHAILLVDDYDTEPMEAMKQALHFYRSRIEKFRSEQPA